MTTRRYPVRQGKRSVSFFTDETTRKQLRLLALMDGTNLQVLLAEAVEMLLDKRGRPEIPAKAKRQ